MKKFWPLILAGLLLVVGLFLFVPRSTDIDMEVEAMEYSLGDAAYAVPHTIVIQGTYTKQVIGETKFQGTLAISGIESTQPPNQANAIFSGPRAYVHYLGFSSDGRSSFLFSNELIELYATSDFSQFSFKLFETTEDGDTFSASWDEKTGRFLAYPAQTREEAVALLDQFETKRP